MKHKIRIEPAGLEFEAEEIDTILEAAEKAGISFPYRCRNGVCTACVCINKNQGQVSYGDLPPIMNDEEKEKGYTFCCIAHALSDITLYHPYIEN
ncbi:2Fe-2S iron-sulfur cluster binding domain-containing protein [Catenovulum sp. SM1970]|uniref:2Fe-2S iron-sulfur cluster-binding protein n=1 Tax=Marinifaba aquimaris TaxID=2741323 RepID=UPI001572142B|nr:2Fe-2S iron-sulfur cluster-binding protein [Marinifaba aquimaris]NTS77294.1 2Fe-2S iron-sulfur cluster binding domain-containing protein [Marinifaba aquimaris]